jgi:hypothetical protein
VKKPVSKVAFQVHNLQRYTVENVFRRMYVVGVGHAASSFALDSAGQGLALFTR